MKNIFLQFVFFISLSAIGQEEIIHDSVIKNLSEILSKDAIIQFQEKYPTYDLFIKDYKVEKIKINERYGQLLEDNRSLIEDVYRDDMVTYGYA